MEFMKIFYAPFFRWYFAIGVSRGPAFFYWRTDAGKVDLTDTLNTFVKHSENFLETFEKKRFQLKKWGFVKIFEPHFEFLSHFLSWKFFFKVP